jgi:hypothetical protein
MKVPFLKPFQKEKGFRFYSRGVIYLPIIGMAIMFCILLSPEIFTLICQKTISVPVISNLQYSERFNILLASAITIFTLVGSYSTYMQVVSTRERNSIEDARNELEKAYGPLYSILNFPEGFEEKSQEKSLKLTFEEFKTIDEIIAVYPWMFPEEIIQLWVKTRKATQFISGGWTDLGQVTVYEVSLEFRDKVNQEYSFRVQTYNRLLRKPVT